MPPFRNLGAIGRFVLQPIRNFFGERQQVQPQRPAFGTGGLDFFTSSNGGAQLYGGEQFPYGGYGGGFPYGGPFAMGNQFPMGGMFPFGRGAFPSGTPWAMNQFTNPLGNPFAMGGPPQATAAQVNPQTVTTNIFLNANLQTQIKALLPPVEQKNALKDAIPLQGELNPANILGNENVKGFLIKMHTDNGFQTALNTALDASIPNNPPLRQMFRRAINDALQNPQNLLTTNPELARAILIPILRAVRAQAAQ